MAQTVIGVFKNSSDASEAKQRLIQEGISSENIDISSGAAMGGSSTASYDNDSAGSTSSASYGNTTGDNDGDSFGDKVSHFFKNLFGGDDDDSAEKYSTVARKGGTLVTVHAASDEQARRAADLLDDAGAADVDELANEYGYSSGSGMSTGSSSNYGSGSGSATDFTSGLGAAAGVMGATAGSGTTGSGSTSGSDYNTGSGVTGSGSTSGSDYNTGSGITGSGSTSGSDYNTGSGLTGSGSTSGSDYSAGSDLASGSTDYNRSGTTGSSDNETLKVIQEDLNVGKREVVTGGVRLRSRIVERPVQEELRLREENVRVERTPVDRAATDADFQTFKEGEIEMTERAEVPVVAKEARVVEEVSLSKEVNERTETISDTVRNTEVDIENIDKDDVRYRDQNRPS